MTTTLEHLGLVHAEWAGPQAPEPDPSTYCQVRAAVPLSVWVAEVDDDEAFLDSSVLAVFTTQQAACAMCLDEWRARCGDQTALLVWTGDDHRLTATPVPETTYSATFMAVLPAWPKPGTETR